MQTQVNNIEQKVDKLYNALIGDDLRAGIIDDVKKNTTHRKNSIKTLGFVSGAGVLLGGLLGKIWSLV